MTDRPFILGVNYWPRRKAMYWWSDFDPGEVRDEFALIAELGLTHVRIFLLWDDFQPGPDTVSSVALDHLTTVCDIAAEQSLGLDITFFTGHMSGPNWAPGWLLSDSLPPTSIPVNQLLSGGQIVRPGYRSPFTDDQVLAAQTLLLHTVVSALHDHPAVWMWNLGNEPDLFATADRQACRDWLDRMIAAIRAIDDRHSITCGLHIESLRHPLAMRVDDVFRRADTAVMHAYPMYIDWLDDPLDPDFVPFTCALTSALCGKPTLMEEFGGPTASPGQTSHVWSWQAYGQPRDQFMASEEDFASYLEAVLPRLVAVGALGAFLWCFADYDPDLYARPPLAESRHERFFGLVRPDGSLKPHAETLRRFSASHPDVRPLSESRTLTVDADAYYADPAAHLRRYYQAFVDNHSQ